MTRSTVGDGPRCPEEGDHGKTYTTAQGHLWCPVSQTLFEGDGLTVGPVIRQGDHVYGTVKGLDDFEARAEEEYQETHRQEPVDWARAIEEGFA